MLIHSSGQSQAIHSADTRSGASVAVAKKALDSSKLQGQMALGLIESAGTPPPATATRGNLVNTYA